MLVWIVLLALCVVGVFAIMEAVEFPNDGSDPFL